MSIRRKTANDVTKIQAVQKAVEEAMQAVLIYLRSETKPTAENAHAIIDTVLSLHNCESPEGHIVAGGMQSVEPHENGSGLLLPGEPIVIDIYPRSKETGFFADMTRTVCIGQPSSQLQKMFTTVVAAQRIAISMLAPGVRCRDVHTVVMDYFTSRGYSTRGQGTLFPFAEGFVHSLGHGVGLAIHESPKLSSKSDDVLLVGDVIAIEPALYYRGIGGVRIEDLLVITEAGYKNLTHFPKKCRV